MADTKPPATGTIGWRDLTVKDAETVRDFYKAVVGWNTKSEPMGGYDDYHMIPPGGDESAAGICHARGANADLPTQWLIYIVVESVEKSAQECERLGGEVVAGPRELGGGLFCVIRDPAGAVCALWQAGR